MADTSDFKNGMCIQFKHDLYQIVSFQHVKPGKGSAFVRTKLKSIKTGKVIDNTFNSGEKVDIARVERRPYQYLYKDDMGYNFMHTQTYEQIPIEESLIEGYQFLKEGQEVEVVVHADNETLLSCELPQYVVMKVTYTEPGIKGDTATNTLKPATVESDAEVMVPLFINTGDLIKIETSSGAYSERVKQ
jgi:elongation factor P